MPADTTLNGSAPTETTLRRGVIAAAIGSVTIACPRIMVVAAWLFVLTSWPCFFLMWTWPTLTACKIAVAWLQLLKAGYSGVRHA
jgi:hypothetical protein